MLQYYICDTETTGLNSATQEIIQISIIRGSDRVQLSRDIRAEFPERASPQALQVTNKTLADIVKGMSKEEAVELFDSFLKEDGLTPAHRVIVGHNIIGFDKKFLHALWEKVGKAFPANMWLDTMKMTREYAKKTGLVKQAVNLKASLELFKIAGVQRFHSASPDCQNTFLLWQRLMDENVDYLTMIKQEPHIIGPADDEKYSFDDIA